MDSRELIPVPAPTGEVRFYKVSDVLSSYIATSIKEGREDRPKLLVKLGRVIHEHAGSALHKHVLYDKTHTLSLLDRPKQWNKQKTRSKYTLVA